jgi:hypothetical protein
MEKWEVLLGQGVARLATSARQLLFAIFPPDPEVFITAQAAVDASGQVIACLDAERCYIRTADHPPEAYWHIREILALEAADMPFNPKEHVSDWRAERVEGRIRTVQVFARRSEVGGLVAQLRGKGYQISAVDVKPSGGIPLGVDLLAGIEPARPRFLMACALTAASLALLVSLGWHAYGELHQRRDALAKLEQQVLSQAAEVKQIIALGAQLRDAEANVQALAGELARPQLSDVWEELASRMEDDSQALRLEYKSDRLVLEGLSSDATRLAGGLSGSKMMGQALQTAPIIRDANGKERFSLTIPLQQAVP